MPASTPAAESRTRLAPSPTGALHLGNARTFLINWALARKHGWRVLLRIEDLDTPRTKAGADQQAIDILAWLGIDWDEGPVYQAQNLAPYRAAMQRLAVRGLAYPLEMTRADLETAAAKQAAAAPQRDAPTETRCPPDFRPPRMPAAFPGVLSADTAGVAADVQRGVNWRFACPGERVRVSDAFAGIQAFTPASTVGDFILWTKRDQPSYQLAVTVDDARHRITHVVRGDDLLESAARQILLYEALGLTRPTHWYHLPLVLGPDGKRLAKRHGDTRLVTYRSSGVAPEAVIGLLATMSGVAGRPEPMSAAAFAAAFDLARLDPRPVVFTEEHHRWLAANRR